jgi:hypothetical protein
MARRKKDDQGAALSSEPTLPEGLSDGGAPLVSSEPASAGGAESPPVPAPRHRMVRVLRVSCTRPGGFRRCGRHFVAAPVDIPLGELAAEELSRLSQEPNLKSAVVTVEVTEE